MATKLKSDKVFRDALQAFFGGIEAGVSSSGNLYDVILSPGGRFAHGALFIESSSTESARRTAVERAGRVLGPVASDEKEVDDLLWRVAAERALKPGSTTIGEALALVVVELEKNVLQRQVYIEQNFAVYFVEAIEDLRIGPVRVVKTALLKAELDQAFPNRPWVELISIPMGPKGLPSMERTPPDTVWAVDLNGSIKNLQEQAAWLVDVALGLIRLAAAREHRRSPDIGSREADPFAAPRARAMGVVVRPDGMNIFNSVGHAVLVDKALYALLASQPFIGHAAVFDAKKGTVGERLAQGLGWMTRGRQSADRAERLLFFFTAIEALLTNDDKTAPVTQTIARHASVILAQKPEDRADIASQFKDLYNRRSALVHTGKRGVSKSDADTVQYLVEALYGEVLERVDLASDFQELNAGLARASYGGAWP